MPNQPITQEPARDDHHRMLSARAFEEHLVYLRAAGAADKTVERARELLYRVDRELAPGLCAAYPEEISAWLARPGWSRATRATYRAHIVRFFDWAVRGPNPCLSYDPSESLPRPKVPRRVPRPATDEQVEAACTRAGEPWRLHCILAAYGGLRCVEIARQDRDDITEQEIVVRGKGDRVRVVPTDPYVWQAVQGLPAGPVTRGPNGIAATADWVSASTRAHLSRTLGVRTTPHRLRAWFGSRALDACGDLRVVQELLGHASVATTQVYTLVNPERRRAAVAGLPRLA